LNFIAELSSSVYKVIGEESAGMSLTNNTHTHTI
jgi:hypothetical protein